MKRIKIYLIGSFLLITVLFSCKKMFDVDPNDPSQIRKADALKKPSDVQEVLNAGYDNISNLYNGRVQYYGELLSDNVIAPKSNNDYNEVFNRATIFFNSSVGGFYGDMYKIIYKANTVLDFIDVVPGFTASEKARMIAEAKFMRALGHFTAVKYFAQPYGYTSDNSHLGIPLRKNSTPEVTKRSTCKESYDFIIKDLTEAVPDLPETNLNNTNATKYAAKALLAKVYFQMNDFANVISQVNDIVNSNLFGLADSVNIYDNSTSAKKEMIFFIKSVNNDQKSGDLRGNYHDVGSNQPQIAVSANLYAVASSRSGDKRTAYYAACVGGFRSLKFDSAYFNIPVLYLTDMLLMRAEALAETTTNLSVAIADVNSIISRAFGGISQNISLGSGAETIKVAARFERRLEMPMEGDRVQQLKRMGAKGEPNILIRNAPWNCNGLALQFPASESTIKGFQMNPEGGCN
ncbi:MAG: RagB/SusD family nutrient uptake outer membrane protein [Bacteroidetes bacterium]|nr:RagB/SusD family nutrient uptake outer membrane protein [Bacteroidota bacterium]